MNSPPSAHQRHYLIQVKSYVVLLPGGKLVGRNDNLIATNTITTNNNNSDRISIGNWVVGWGGGNSRFSLLRARANVCAICSRTNCD